MIASISSHIIVFGLGGFALFVGQVWLIVAIVQRIIKLFRMFAEFGFVMGALGLPFWVMMRLDRIFDFSKDDVFDFMGFHGAEKGMVWISQHLFWPQIKGNLYRFVPLDDDFLAFAQKFNFDLNGVQQGNPNPPPASGALPAGPPGGGAAGGP
jgi:hypothetical protein